MENSNRFLSTTFIQFNTAKLAAAQSDVICIVTHTWPLKTNVVAAENKCTWQPFLVIELASIFMYTEVVMPKNSRSLVATLMI